MTPTRDLAGAAIYIERDGAKRVADVAAARLGLNAFEGSMGAFGTYRFYVRDEDIKALDSERDRVYARLHRTK